MDYTTLRVQLEQSRRFEVPVDGATFILRLPPEHAWRGAVEGNRDGSGRLLEAKAMRVLLDAAIAGWNGVTARHFLPDAPEEPIAFTAPARAELLDCRQDIADELAAAMAERRTAQRAKLESARKN